MTTYFPQPLCESLRTFNSCPLSCSVCVTHDHAVGNAVKNIDASILSASLIPLLLHRNLVLTGVNMMKEATRLLLRALACEHLCRLYSAPSCSN